MSKKDKGFTTLENISYENGDGLSEHIAKLIAPPGGPASHVADITPSAGKGKGSAAGGGSVAKPNNDYCSYCREGGGLICCERCPAAYHYHCCEPPLDPNNLPSEEWLCNSCAPPTAKPIMNEKNIYLSKAVFEIGAVPTPYELPHDLHPTSDLPGNTELQSRKRRNLNPTTYEQSKRKFNSTYPFDLHHFTPTPVCYKCDRSDRGNKPLIFCGYCPLAFHLDCIYPPLPFRPSGLWMCPLHPQYSTDRFHSLRLSERIKAHEGLLEAVNEHEVREKFLKKARETQPGLEGVQRVTTIPEAIHQYYELGLLFCRSKVRVPRSLKSLSAERLAGWMAGREVPSECRTGSCQHASKECKHYGQQDERHPSASQGADILKGMSDEAIRKMAIQFLSGKKPVNGEVKPNLSSFVMPPPPKAVSRKKGNCLPLEHTVAHSFLVQGNTRYPIKKNSFTIGTDRRADLCLDEAVSCDATSDRHCCISFDKVTGVHELLNYSEYGLTVDEVLYGCHSGSVHRCRCSPRSPLLGWEGPCQLPHGALIRIGCHSFAFETNPEFLWTPELIPAVERASQSKRNSLDFMT